jgi:ABC-2 type transport system permease protein
MLSRLLALVTKEILAIWRDPKSRFTLIVPPLIQLFVFSYAATYDVTNISVAVLDEDGGPEAREFLSRFEGAPAFARLLPVAREADLRRLIDTRRAIAGLHLGPDFSRRLEGRPPAPVRVVLDGRMSNTAQVVMGYVNNVVAAYNAERSAGRGWPEPPSILVTRAWFNPNLHSQWVVVPGLVAILTQMLGLVVTALSVARERELGTLEQLLVTPLRPWEILLGKTIPALLIGLVEGSIIVVVAQAWFGIPLTGSVALLYLGLALFLVAAIGVGLFISALAQTQQQAILGAFMFMVPSVILSGFATPIENMPDWVQTLTLVNPIRYFLIVLHGIFLKDMPASLVFEQLWPLALIAAVTFAGSAWLFRRRLG